jgi:hypothetical protein
MAGININNKEKQLLLRPITLGLPGSNLKAIKPLDIILTGLWPSRSAGSPTCGLKALRLIPMKLTSEVGTKDGIWRSGQGQLGGSSYPAVDNKRWTTHNRKRVGWKFEDTTI